MIDIKALRENPDLFRNSQKVRGEDPALIDHLIKADDLRRTAITEFEALRVHSFPTRRSSDYRKSVV